jgi:hypothetical protein
MALFAWVQKPVIVQLVLPVHNACGDLTRIADHQEFVVRERAWRRHAVMHIAHPDTGARIRILVITFVLNAAGTEHDMRTLAEGLQQPDELRVVELEERGEDMTVVLVCLGEETGQFLMHWAA